MRWVGSGNISRSAIYNNSWNRFAIFAVSCKPAFVGVTYINVGYVYLTSNRAANAYGRAKIYLGVVRTKR